MEQMYLIEIFIDKVTVFASDENEKSGADKNLIIKIKFGPKVQFIIKEGQLAVNEKTTDDIVECDENGRRKWSRTIRVGKSYLFPSYPDTVLMILSKFPLEIEVWNDDENEVEIFVGIGTMHWDTKFFHMLKDTAEACKLHEPLSIKQCTPLFAECCCRQVGEISFILRLSALGDSIITEFQQLMKDPESFVFRTNKAPSMFQCKRVDGADPNFCMVGSLYETTTLEDPDIAESARKKIEICTELQNCGAGGGTGQATCDYGEDDMMQTQKEYPIDKIRMGDITGPCGNANCALAHKVKTYLRNLDSYKVASGGVSGTKDESSRKACGTCSCKDDRWHRETCPENENSDGAQNNAVCTGCSGIVKKGDTCEDKKNKMYGTGATPKGSKTHVAYVFSVTKVPDFNQSLFGQNYTIGNFTNNSNGAPGVNKTENQRFNEVGCCCQKLGQIQIETERQKSTKSIPQTSNAQYKEIMNSLVYLADTSDLKRKIPIYNCTELTNEKDCKCDPPKPKPPCKTLDCDCIAETANIAARKAHKPYCPSYKHKNNCPVTYLMHEDEEKKKPDDDEDEIEPLPYGLPPVQLGPCPVLGRPCTVPDGFARMYKTAALPTQPPSYSDAGKVCCSKEYERIKKAIREYMKKDKDDDFRCVNKFNVDTERRCCDKEQRLFPLTGKSCCGSHKLSIQEKFKEEKKHD
ncbi:uncharacterized protein LOC114243971 [Bombyx mandarina]|uniref:Uncharacterized protein LOC114243971 n=1 Tax=Bombyx mandarina TaxID=7092 RepID=A0A6J2JP25_BOMMA|nr:uncharacterized protein LOC114243971 [Bombyx mandarina]